MKKKKDFYDLIFLKIKNINFDKIYILIGLFLSLIGIFLARKTYYIAIPEYNEFIEKTEIPNLNGNWEFTFITEEADIKKYIGMNDKYDIFLIGSKDEYKGKGEKFESYGNTIEPKNRAKFEFEIVIKKSNLYGFFTANDAREYNGNFEVKLNKEGNKFEGNFNTSAANSKGKVIGIRKETHTK